MVAQRIHIDLIAQSSAEGRDCASRIVLTAIETAVDNGLDALTQGLEEARNGEGRGYDNKRRLRELARNQAYQRSQTDHQPGIDQGQQDRQRTIDQRAVDQQINIVEPEAQNSQTRADLHNKYREQKRGGDNELIERAGLPQGREEQQGYG